METAEDFLSSYAQIKETNKRALIKIVTAKELEKQEKPLEAIAAYKESLKLIDKLFSIPVGLPDDDDDDDCNVESEWTDACAIINNLKDVKSFVIQKLNELKSQHILVDIDDDEKAEAEILDSPSGTFKRIVKDLREILADKNVTVSYDTLYQAQVKLYKIQPNNVVQTIAGECAMSLVMCNIGDKWSHLNGIYFIQCSIKGQETETSDGPSTSQVNDLVWIYPLLPSSTTCYRTEYEAFILPDLEGDDLGSAFGILLSPPPELSKEQFDDMQQFFVDLLEAILTNPLEILVKPKDTCSQKVSNHIVTAADFLAKNLVKGAEKTANLMNQQSTPYIISKMNPASENPSPVPQGVQTTVEVAKDLTTAAVDLTSWVADKVGTASCAIGRFLSPHIQQHGNTLLQKTCGMDEEQASKKIDSVFTVATGAVEGFSTLFHGLEKAAFILGTNLKKNSVEIVEYKYGSSAGLVTADTFDSFGNVFIVSHNVHYMLPAGIAKKATFAAVDEYNQNNKAESQHVLAEGLYPDLRTSKDKTEKSRGA